MMVAPLGALLGLVVTKDIGTATTSPAVD